MIFVIVLGSYLRIESQTVQKSPPDPMAIVSAGNTRILRDFVLRTPCSGNITAFNYDHKNRLCLDL